MAADRVLTDPQTAFTHAASHVTTNTDLIRACLMSLNGPKSIFKEVGVIEQLPEDALLTLADEMLNDTWDRFPSKVDDPCTVGLKIPLGELWRIFATAMNSASDADA